MITRGGKVGRLAWTGWVLAMLQGCATVTYQAGQNVDMMLNAPPASQVAGSFKREVNHHAFLWGIISPNVVDLAQISQEEITARQGRAVMGLKVYHYNSVLNLALGVLTLGLYAPTTSVIEGDVVR